MFGWGKKSKEGTTDTAVKTPEKKKKEGPSRETAAGLKIKVTDRQPCQVTLSVHVPEERMEEATEESFQRIQAKVKLPGFRPGKVPMDIVRKNFEGSAREDALDRTLRETVYEALQEEKLTAVATPAVDKIDYEPGKPLRFEMKVECAPEFALKDYKGLALQKKVKTFADADIDKKVEEIRESNARLAVSEDKDVSEKHFVVVDYAGTADGQPLPGGEAKGQLIDMSAPQTIAGFTEGLKGMKLGETKDIGINFPADYPKKDLAGKPVTFKVTVVEIKEKRLPDLNDDFAKDLRCESLADMRERIRKNLEVEFQKSARQDLERQISDQLLEANPFPVPPSLAKEHTQYLTQRLKQHLMQQGASEEDWKANEGKMAAKNQAEAERQLRLSYILSAIAREEKVDVSEPELDDVIKKSMEGVEAARRPAMEKWMESRRDTIRSQMVEEKVYTLLIENAKTTEISE